MNIRTTDFPTTGQGELVLGDRREIGRPRPIPPADVDALLDRYQNVYGQP